MRSALVALFLMCSTSLFAGPLMLSNFSLPQVDREGAISYETLKEKTVLIQFWASWCGTCSRELDRMSELVKSAPNAVLLTVSEDEQRSDAHAALKKHLKRKPFEALHVLDADGSFAKKLGIEGVPGTVVLAPGGEVKLKVSTHPDKAQFETIKTLLGVGEKK
jgi:thiol-disulfide isomerase/thioredoxin